MTSQAFSRVKKHLKNLDVIYKSFRIKPPKDLKQTLQQGQSGALMLISKSRQNGLARNAGTHKHAHTHGHMHVFAAQISKNRFFSMTQFLFSCKRGEKKHPQKSPSPTFTWGNRALRDRSADRIRNEDYLNFSRGKLMVSRSLWRSCFGNWISMHVQ